MIFTRPLSFLVTGACALGCVPSVRTQSPASPPAASTAKRAPGVDDPKASELLREALRLIQQRNWDDARRRLDEARAINPRQPLLYSEYGFLTIMMGKPNDAVDDLRHELADHPGEDRASILLAGVLQLQGKLPEALAVIKPVVDADAANIEAAGTYATLLYQSKDYAGTEKVSRQILTVRPDLAAAQMLLANALNDEGKPESRPELLTLLKSIVEKSSDPLTLNNVGYLLADKDLDPPAAEHAARRAMAVVEQQVSDAATDGDEKKSIQLTEVVANIWDTLGWALFRENKVAAAEPFVRAAWLHGLDAEAGLHLGLILEKQGQRAAAMSIYQVALFGEPGSTPDLVKSRNLDRQAALRKAGLGKPVQEGKDALQAQRAYKVPGPNNLTGSATVDIDYSIGGAANARIVKPGPDSATLSPVLKLLPRIDYRLLIPLGSNAHLTRRGTLTCHAGKTCDFVLLSPHAAVLSDN